MARTAASENRRLLSTLVGGLLAETSPAADARVGTARKTRVFSGSAADNEGAFAPQDWGLFVAVSLIWGASFLLIAESLESFTLGVVTFGRVSFGAATLWGLRLLRQPGRRIEVADRARTPPSSPERQWRPDPARHRTDRWQVRTDRR